MKSKRTSEKSKNPEKKSKKISGWKKVTTAISLVWVLASCDSIPNNQIILNPHEWSEKFNVEYQFYEWSTSIRIVDYDVTVSKNWNWFTWFIHKKDWRISEDTTITSNNLDDVFNRIAWSMDDRQVTDSTLAQKDEKIAFAKQTYKDSVLNRKTPAKKWEVRIKYKKKK